MNRLPRVFGVLAAALLMSACSEAPTKSDGRYRIVATVGMIADVVREIAGPHARVETLIGPGVDPHLYQASSADVNALRSADLVFYNGLLLEGRLSAVLGRLAQSGKAVHAVTEALLRREGYVLHDEGAQEDPHVWMDVQGWIAASQLIEGVLSEHDPEHAADYAANGARYREQLDRLDDYARQSIASIPESQRVLVTAHDAFRYLSRAYGIEVRGIQGLSTESEAGVRDIEALVQFLVERRIPAVFVESSVSDKSVRALLEGAAARGHQVVIGGELYSDAMGPAGRYEGSYIGMIDHNITTLVRALGGSAPAGGFQGKLASSP